MFATDGARSDREGEAELVRETKLVADMIDWKCDVQRLFRDENLGCRRDVSGALDSFFENHDHGVIIEDDIIPTRSFLPFCGDLLDRYAANKKIGSISGQNFTKKNFRSDSYFFNGLFHCHGWATWKDSWQEYGGAFNRYHELGGIDYLSDYLRSRILAKRMDDCVNEIEEGKLSSWAYQFFIASCVNQRLSITPRFNLVKNQGFGVDATHTDNSWPRFERQLSRSKEIDFPLTHPTRNERDFRAERSSYWVWHASRTCSIRSAAYKFFK